MTSVEEVSSIDAPHFFIDDNSLLNVDDDDTDVGNQGTIGGYDSSNGQKAKGPNRSMNEVFSDESTQAVYEEIEVQHQSQSQDGWRSNSQPQSHHVHHGNEYSPVRDIEIHNRPPRHVFGKATATLNDSFNNMLRSPGKSMDSSQSQSVSTWFPVPPIPALHAKPHTHQPHHDIYTNMRSSSPMSSQDRPFDEKKKPQYNISNTLYHSAVPNILDEQISPSKIHQQSRIKTRTFSKLSIQDRPWRTNSNQTFSPNTYKTNDVDTQDFRQSNNISHVNSTESNSLLDNSQPMKYQNPFSSNSSEAESNSRSPLHCRHPLSSNSNEASTTKSNSRSPPRFLRNPFSSNSSDALQQQQQPPPPVYRNPFSSSDSERTKDNPSPRRFRNPFSSKSSNSTFIEQSLSLQSMKPPHESEDIPQSNAYKNPFDSGSTSIEDVHSHPRNNNQGRRVSKSPERERIIRPKSSSMNNDSKFHSLLSCATSPSDPRWLEALQLLSNAPNPTQLAKMKISHAHEWTALHIASLSNPPLYIIYGLLLVYPEAVREFDKGGRLPIHLAAGSEASASILSILVRFYNESVIIKEGQGLVPLHLALLRDGGEEVSAEIVQVLLGQNIHYNRGQGGTRKVKDGTLRRGEHLNLKLSDVKTGMFGDNPNAISMKERRKRELRLKNMNPQNIETYSRGFTSDINEVDSTDGIPQKHEYLTSLWDEEGVMDVDIFGNIELIETQKFSFEVQNCLRKLSKVRNKRKGDEEKSNHSLDSEIMISPACIPAPKMRLPIHMAIKRNYTVSDSCRLQTEKQNNVLRILINANPASLMHQDSLGKTPLITCLELAGNKSIYPIDLEMVELLLGFRTRDFPAAPEWLEDNDIVESQQRLCRKRSQNSFIGYSAYNPAMIPYGDTVPLHLAVAKQLPSPVICTIYFFFPGAKYIQDERKCTPLHYALQQSSTDVELDLSIISLLIDRRIVAVRDMLNLNAFDMLVENCKNGRLSNYTYDYSSTFCLENYGVDDVKAKMQVLFQKTFEETSSNNDHNPSNNSTSSLEDLRYLPAWLRNHAFGTLSVQKALINKISSPLSTALIIINAIALFILIAFYMSSVDVVLTQGGSISPSFIGFIFTSSVYLGLYGLYNALTTFRLQMGWKCCICNIWSWVTLIGLLLSVTSSIQLITYETNSTNNNVVGERDSFITLVLTTIGFLWAMVVGFACRWFYGVSILCLSLIKMLRSLLPTLTVLIIIIMSFMQMIYVTQHKSLGYGNQCIGKSDEGLSEVCNIWDAFKIPYYVASGKELYNLGPTATYELATNFVVLMTIIFIILVHSVSTTILNMKTYMSTEKIVDFFWLPMLSHVLLVKDICNLCSFQKHERSFGAQERSFSQSRLAHTWDFILASYESAQLKNTKWGYFQRHLGRSHLLNNTLFVRFVGVFLIPIWLVLGLLSLGILWPPQCRRWLFSWSLEDNYNETNRKQVKPATPVSMLQEEISRMKGMVFERFHDMQRDLDNIKRHVE